MSSMISTVLEIEREAESLLSKSAEEARQLVEDAARQRRNASEEAAEQVKKELQEIEAKARADRENKIQELTASGQAALAKVKNIADDTFDAGVRHIMKALAGE